VKEVKEEQGRKQKEVGTKKGEEKKRKRKNE